MRARALAPRDQRQFDRSSRTINHDDFQSVSLKVDGPLAPERFDAWLGALPDMSTVQKDS